MYLFSSTRISSTRVIIATRRDVPPREAISGTDAAVARFKETSRNMRYRWITKRRTPQEFKCATLSGDALYGIRLDLRIYTKAWDRDTGAREARDEEPGRGPHARDPWKREKERKRTGWAPRGASLAWVENSPWPGGVCRDCPLCTCHSIFIPL